MDEWQNQHLLLPLGREEKRDCMAIRSRSSRTAEVISGNVLAYLTLLAVDTLERTTMYGT